LGPIDLQTRPAQHIKALTLTTQETSTRCSASTADFLRRSSSVVNDGEVQAKQGRAVLQKAGSGSGGERTELRFDRCDGKNEAQVKRGRKEGRAEPPKCICAPLDNHTVVDRLVVFRVVDTNILPWWRTLARGYGQTNHLSLRLHPTRDAVELSPTFGDF
jgi:hypothetical protein